MTLADPQLQLFEIIELRLVKVGFAWIEFTLYGTGTQELVSRPFRFFLEVVIANLKSERWKSG
jgi:hypothetical protein